MLDHVKAVAAEYPTLRVINVEPYELTDADGTLQPVLSNGFPTPVEVVRTYGILSEPWTYAIGADGIVTASFEASVDEVELREAFAALDGPGG
jgi:hypothetical protein